MDYKFISVFVTKVSEDTYSLSQRIIDQCREKVTPALKLPTHPTDSLTFKTQLDFLNLDINIAIWLVDSVFPSTGQLANYNKNNL